MKPSNSCKKCGSKDIQSVKYLGISCIICKKCGYDEREIYLELDDERTSQKEKGRFAVYKAGGTRRTIRKK